MDEMNEMGVVQIVMENFLNGKIVKKVFFFWIIHLYKLEKSQMGIERVPTLGHHNNHGIIEDCINVDK